MCTIMTIDLNNDSNDLNNDQSWVKNNWRHVFKDSNDIIFIVHVLVPFHSLTFNCHKSVR